MPEARQCIFLPSSEDMFHRHWATQPGQQQPIEYTSYEKDWHFGDREAVLNTLSCEKKNKYFASNKLNSL